MVVVTGSDCVPVACRQIAKCNGCGEKWAVVATAQTDRLGRKSIYLCRQCAMELSGKLTKAIMEAVP